METSFYVYLSWWTRPTAGRQENGEHFPLNQSSDDSIITLVECLIWETRLAKLVLRSLRFGAVESYERLTKIQMIKTNGSKRTERRKTQRVKLDIWTREKKGMTWPLRRAEGEGSVFPHVSDALQQKNAGWPQLTLLEAHRRAWSVEESEVGNYM